MIITTKYDIDNQLWHIKKIQKEYVVDRNFIINYIRVFRNLIVYRIFDEIIRVESFIYEHQINNIGEYYFTTREAAQEECDRRNKRSDRNDL